MEVTFVSFGPSMASSRLRADIPQRELEKFGIRRGKDILVYGKHFVNNVPKWITKVYDVCDDHLDHPELGWYYREHIKEADAVTCNSETMRGIIKQKTGRDAYIIPDPFESDEQPAGMGEGLLWFGHQSNLKQLYPYLDLNPEILTGAEWSREKQLKMLAQCAIVLIPTDNRQAKSANRLIEAVRNGRFVVAGELPAHDEFKPYVWIGDIYEGVEWALSHREEAIEKVRSCQDYVKDKYSPEAIAKQWLSVLESVWH